MNKLILNNKEYTLNDELTAQLIETITKQDEVKSGRWVPAGQYYYFVDSVGEIPESYFSGDDRDEYRLSQGNVFKTSEEAKSHLTYLKALATIKEDAEWWEPDWENDDQSKFYAKYDHYREDPVTDSWHSYQYQGVVYFETREKLNESFKTHRAEWLCVFGISEEDK